MREKIAMCKLMLILLVMVAVVYPILLSVMAHVFFPEQAAGSLIYYQHQPIGSRLLGQEFRHPAHFQGRPSLTAYQSDIFPGEDLLLWTKIKAYPKNLPEMQLPSASMLDPHVSWKAIVAQMPRVAKARGISLQDLHLFIQKHGFQHALVNVLLLNLALDEKWNIDEKTQS